MTVRSWSEFRIFQDGLLVYTAATEKDAKQWAKDSRAVHVNFDPKYICTEVGVLELPKKRFAV